MSIFDTRNLRAILIIALICITSAASASAQGKGHGGGKGGGGGNHGGPPPNAGRQGPPPQMERQPQQRPQPQFQRQQAQHPQPQFQRPQPQFQRQQAQHPQPQFQRPQPQVKWQMPPMQGHGRMPQQIWRPDPRDQEQQKVDRGRGRAKQDRAYNYPAPGLLGPPIEQGNARGRGGHEKHEKVNGYPAPGLLAPPIENGGQGRWDRGRRDRFNVFPSEPAKGNRAWPNNYGYERSTAVHLRNAERKALKEQARLQGRYFDDRFDRVVRIDAPRQDSWRDNVIRSVVYNVIANSAPAYSYYPSPVSSGYGYATYQYPAYSYYSGYPSNYNYSGYSGYPSYVTTTYNFYDPYDYTYYDPYSYSSSSYYVNDPYYSYDAYDVGLPILSGSGTGGFLSRLFSELTAYGYNQGYRDALNARSLGYQTRYISDPYDPYVYVDEYTVFEDVGYDPYSCVGENRRYLSEGYELGYRDALYGSSQYDPYYDNGNVDLISALITTTLSVS